MGGHKPSLSDTFMKLGLPHHIIYILYIYILCIYIIYIISKHSHFKIYIYIMWYQPFGLKQLSFICGINHLYNDKYNPIGGFNPSEKYEFVSWDDSSHRLWRNNPNVPNHQPDNVRWLTYSIDIPEHIPFTIDISTFVQCNQYVLYIISH